MSKLPLFFIFSLGLTNAAMADFGQLRCRFSPEKDKQCWVTVSPCVINTEPVGNTSCKSGYRVNCNGMKIYDGAFTAGFTIFPLAGGDMDIHDKGVTAIAAMEANTAPRFPTLKYDATDFLSPFSHVDARLYFTSEKYVRGECSYNGQNSPR